MAIVLAFGAALAYAVAMVLQQRSARRADPALSLRPGLIVDLLGRRAWTLGLVVNGIAFALRAGALRWGSLVLVQPLVLSGLVLAVVIEATLDRRRMTARETWGAAGIIGGLSLFLFAASPSRGVASPSPMAWVALVCVFSPLLALGLVVAARRHGSASRAAWLAFAAGLMLAVTAALAKQTFSALGHDSGHALLTVAPYALALTAVVGILLTQSAFQAGPLRASLPALSVVEPLASIVIGVSVFRERLTGSPTALVAQGLGLLLLVAGVVSLTRAPGLGAAGRAPASALRQDGAMSPRRRIAVVPAYNEERTVAAVLDRLAPLVDHVVIVDDGSVDGTRKAIESCLPRHSHVRLLAFDANHGMSAAYYAAFCDLRGLLARGELAADDLVLTVDADGQHELSVLDHLTAVTVSDGLDALLVRRDLSTYPRYKQAGNQLLSLWASAWAGSRLEDVESGYRVFRLGALCDALGYYRGYRYSETVEVAVVMCRLGYRVRNDLLVPVPVYRSRTRLRDAAIDFAAIPAAAWRVWRRRPRALEVNIAG